MKPSALFIVGALALILTSCAAPPESLEEGGGSVAAQQSPAGVPEYRVDPFWPKPLPDNWLLGGVSGVTVDEQDHVWILHRPKRLGQGAPSSVRRCCVAAPAVIEFDPEGNVVQAWGGEAGEGYPWPFSEHGIEVDRLGNVWTTDEGRSETPTDGGYMVQKFTRDGKFLLQIGNYGVRGEDDDVENLGQVAQARVDVDANEVYVAEGHRTRRVIVFDATTGAYKRKWNAYGNPTAPALHGERAPAFDPAAPPSQDFGEAHCLSLSRDGFVYVCDRAYNRIQVFQKDGTFVEEIVFMQDAVPQVSPWDLALSADPEQRFLFVGDGARQKIFIVQRKPLRVVGSFGRPGRLAGEFLYLNTLAVDSMGNIYTGEVTTGDRVQKFVPVSAGG